MKKVIIVGGGLGGLASAVYAQKAGWQTHLFEASPHLGGRARSFPATDIGEYIDNGQHVLSNAYQETRELLDIIGVTDAIEYQTRLSLQYRFSSTDSVHFQAHRLPSPLHLFFPLLTQLGISWKDLLFSIRWGLRQLFLNTDALRQMTVRDWLSGIDTSGRLYQALWEPMTLATINTPAEKASAYLLYTVMEKAFLKGASASGLGIARRWLGDIFGQSLEKFLLNNGGVIHRNQPIRRIFLSDQHQFDGVVAKNGEPYIADRLILAIPAFAVDKIGLESGFKICREADQFEYESIITVYFWTQKPLPGPFPISLVQSPLQWLFPLPEQSTEDKFGYSIVISSANSLLGKPQDEMLKMIDKEFSRLFGESLQEGYGLIKSKIIKEKRATFSQTPQAERIRPDSQSDIDGILLAGDWTNTGLPATIEGAILSGRRAAAILDA